MATLPADPLTDTDWLLVDGTNLLHALSKAPVAAPRSALVARLRGAVPSGIAIDVVFDGPSEPGLRGERIATGLRVRYSGPRTADAVLLSLVDEVRAVDGPIGTAALLVVTDDRDLRHALHLKGARTAGAQWLLGRLARSVSDRPQRTSARPLTKSRGVPRIEPASDIPSASDTADEDERPGWTPGRGATAKHGNPRRSARRRPG